VTATVLKIAEGDKGRQRKSGTMFVVREWTNQCRQRTGCEAGKKNVAMEPPSLRLRNLLKSSWQIMKPVNCGGREKKRKIKSPGEKQRNALGKGHMKDSSPVLGGRERRGTPPPKNAVKKRLLEANRNAEGLPIAEYSVNLPREFTESAAQRGSL